MESLAVEPKYQRRGIGSQLVRRCEEMTQQWGFDRLMLQVYAENREAIQFYETCGYREVCEDNTIQRPVSINQFGFTSTPRIRWQVFCHKVMVKQLAIHSL
eukprot:GGOE01019523.1.p4 GENE.GGOE01019523.1~~GGOE01019523.1.p4  ORF type:complete len:101 (-),score=21.35 GGOE01019523.1:119-421(-)